MNSIIRKFTSKFYRLKTVKRKSTFKRNPSFKFPSSTGGTLKKSISAMAHFGAPARGGFGR